MVICCSIGIQSAAGQTIGGQTVFNFLRLSPTPQLTALGGINISQPSPDVGLAFNNPSLLQPGMHTQLNAAFNNIPGGVNTYFLALGYHYEKWKTSFQWGLHFLDYGSLIQTDLSGNVLGNFRPTDWVMQAGFSRQYLNKWSYGASIKFIQSNYGQYRSAGIASDVGVLFIDTTNRLSLSILAKNMGFQLKPYEGTTLTDLPFDLQLGITKRLENAPFSFSVTAHHLHRFDINYNDTAFNNENGFENSKGGIDKLFRHFVFAATIHVVDQLEVQAGYNHLRRKELNVGEAGNGLNGFSLGVGVLLKKLTFRYARTHYQNNVGTHQLGLNLKLKSD